MHIGFKNCSLTFVDVHTIHTKSIISRTMSTFKTWNWWCVWTVYYKKCVRINALYKIIPLTMCGLNNRVGSTCCNKKENAYIKYNTFSIFSMVSAFNFQLLGLIYMNDSKSRRTITHLKQYIKTTFVNNEPKKTHQIKTPKRFINMKFRL